MDWTKVTDSKDGFTAKSGKSVDPALTESLKSSYDKQSVKNTAVFADGDEVRKDVGSEIRRAATALGYGVKIRFETDGKGNARAQYLARDKRTRATQ